MAKIGEVSVKIGADISEFQKKMETVAKKMQGIGDKLTGMGTKLTAAVTVPLAGISVAAVKMGANYEAAVQQIDRTLGASSKVIKEWTETQARSFKMAKSDATKYSAVYSNLLSSFIKDQKENAKLTTQLLQQSAVVAAATGRTMEDVMERIRSGLLGNTEAIILSVA